MSSKQFDALMTIKQLASEPAAQQPKSKDSFGNCPSRFAGQRDNDAVEQFRSAIETYKKIEHINDTDALRGICLWPAVQTFDI